jgi:hypothetical protein
MKEREKGNKRAKGPGKGDEPERRRWGILSHI